MNNKVHLKTKNGLGDKLLDVIGFYVLCKYLNYIPYVSFDNTGIFEWGNNIYDNELFNYNNIIITNNGNGCHYYMEAPNASVSLCPYNVYLFLKKFFAGLTFEKIASDFSLYAKNIIKPSQIISSKFPNGIENAYGIHLRKSDKLKPNADIRHENLFHEFKIIINALLNDVKNIIIQEEEPVFLVVSEDDSWKNEIENIMYNIAKNNNKTIKILQIDYTNSKNYNNYKSVLDMFCLSKCKEILQGVKNSNFSLLSSILGNGELRNYSKHINDNNKCIIVNAWSCVVNINGKKNYDISINEIVTNNFAKLNTNIDKIYDS